MTGIKRERIRVIYNPVITPELFEKADVPVDHPWFVKNQPPVIIAVGRLIKQKDFQTLIRAFKIVRREQTARLVILGEGGERAELERLIREIGVGEDVWMPGFVENPYAYMSRADIFVLSSITEGLPTVLIEAVALGIPVVSTDCPHGPREILALGGSGHLVAVSDVVSLAKCLKNSLESNENNQNFTSSSSFTFENSLQNYKDLIEDYHA